VRRKEFDLSVDELAALTAKYDYEADYADGSGVSVPTLYRYEKGERLPGARELRLLCDALNVPPDWLLLGSEWKLGDRPAIGAKVAVMVRARLQEIVGELSELVALDSAVGDFSSSGEAWRETEHKLKLQEVKDRFKK
jgi:transcriptional regulator with XRE-family HTH domain